MVLNDNADLVANEMVESLISMVLDRIGGNLQSQKNAVKSVNTGFSPPEDIDMEQSSCKEGPSKYSSCKVVSLEEMRSVRARREIDHSNYVWMKPDYSQRPSVPSIDWGNLAWAEPDDQVVCTGAISAAQEKSDRRHFNQ